MIVRSRLLLSTLCLALLAIGPVSTAAANEGQDLMRAMGFGGLKGKKLAKAIVAADAFPLGSEKNPVRVNMPRGQRAYLSRLRCPDAAPPQFERAGSTGAGPFGNLMDLYRVTCTGAKPLDIYMDMYHDQAETRALPGFAIDEQ